MENRLLEENEEIRETCVLSCTFLVFLLFNDVRLSL